MTPAERHPTPEELAELDAGLLPAGPAEQARAHLTSCPDCAAVSARLAEVRRRLAAVTTGPMPGDLAARLDAAVRAAVGGAQPATVATVVPATPRLRGRPRTGLASLAAAAAAAVLVAAVVAGVLRLGAHHPTSANAPTGLAGAAARPGAPQFLESSSGRNYTRATIVADLPLLLAGSAVTSLSASPVPATRARAGVVQSSPAGALPAGLARLQASTQALFACAAILADEPTLVVPRAVDFARYNGTPAAVIVLPSRTQLGWVQVWVVGPGGCSTSATDIRFFAQAFVP